ncbi:HD domain-containing phosphohydrolase [Thalassobaculum sp.]|uniref:HD domain-containing phosphohydrolase n=1 Tax=Thalassobaculum sp. TaxID=2022740 RepID=UPI0032EFB159
MFGENALRDRSTVLIVDDDRTVRGLLQRALHLAGYRTAVAADGYEALATLATFEQPITAVVTDAIMPGLAGTALVEEAHARGLDLGIRFYLMSGNMDVIARWGNRASGFHAAFTKPFDIGHVVRQLDEDLAPPPGAEPDVQANGIGWLARALAQHDSGTGAHSNLVTRYTAVLARAMAVPDDIAVDIADAAALHDVGKIGVPEAILNKPGPLDAAEVAVMRGHGEIGYSILSREPHRLAGLAAQIARHHHDRFDGSGYTPLAGFAIPLPARIVAVADIYDALRSARPYKPALSHEEAAACLLVGDGRTDPSHFDPDVLTAFRSALPEFQRIVRYGPGTDETTTTDHKECG